MRFGAVRFSFMVLGLLVFVAFSACSDEAAGTRPDGASDTGEDTKTDQRDAVDQGADVECATGADCPSGVCDENSGVCLGPSCSDQVKNGDETDVDCGGLICDACGENSGCGVDTDCVSGVCTANVCQPATCSDGVVNQDETDVDCGGEICEACDSNRVCADDDDCESGICMLGLCAEIYHVLG